METDKAKDAVAFMSRHSVALACEYESINRDGSIHARGTAVYSGFLMEIYGRTFWVTAGHCLKEELDANIDEGTLRITGGGFMDFFGHEATHHHRVPYTYEAHSAFYVDEPDDGFDFALLPLDDLICQQFAANKLIPITRSNWVHQPRLSFDFYRMLGIPRQCVFQGQALHEVKVRQTMIAVDRLTAEDVAAPPPGVDVPSKAWFIGWLHPDAAISDIKGMSGGLIFGFRRDADGNLLYHPVAIQSRWWDKSRIIFGCSIPYFAELVHRQLEEFARGCEDCQQSAIGDGEFPGK